MARSIKITKALTISIQGEGQIFSATIKGADIQEARTIGNSLWALVKSPYIAFIKDETGQTILKTKF